MRISDWSSDVCSSDLGTTTNGAWENFLPISGFTSSSACSAVVAPADTMPALTNDQNLNRTARVVDRNGTRRYVTVAGRSEEHTSELQSLMRISYAVFCLDKKHQLAHV